MIRLLLLPAAVTLFLWAALAPGSFAHAPARARTSAPTPLMTTTLTTTTAQWAVDPARSSLALQVFKDAAASALAHDHIVEAREFAGTFEADPADPRTAKIDITVQTSSLVVDQPQTRAQYGLPVEVSPGDRKAVEKTMKAEEQLHVSRFRTIRFISTKVTPAPNGTLQLMGKLTLHGVTRQVSLPVDATLIDDGKSVEGRGTLRFKTSDFGINPYAAMLGAIRNQDEVLLHIHLVAATTPG